METAYDGRQVGRMDLHRRRSVLVRMTEEGQRLATSRVSNGPQELSDWGAHQVIALDADRGRHDVVATVPSFPMCIDFLPDGRLLIVDSARRRLLAASRTGRWPSMPTCPGSRTSRGTTSWDQTTSGS
jgi:hypothetical protein